MRKTYNVYYSAGNEPIKELTMYAEKDTEIIKCIVEQMLSIKNSYPEELRKDSINKKEIK